MASGNLVPSLMASTSRNTLADVVPTKIMGSNESKVVSRLIELQTSSLHGTK